MMLTLIKSRYFIQPKLLRDTIFMTGKTVGAGEDAELVNQQGLPFLKS